MKTGVARKTIDINEYREQLAYRQGKVSKCATSSRTRRAPPVDEAYRLCGREETKIIRAAYQIQEEGIATPVLIGRKAVIDEQIKNLDSNISPRLWIQ